LTFFVLKEEEGRLFHSGLIGGKSYSLFEDIRPTRDGVSYKGSRRAWVKEVGGGGGFLQVRHHQREVVVG